MRILLVVSAPAYMSPSPKDKNYIDVLRNAGLKIPALDVENEFAYLEVARQFSRRARDLFQGYFKKIMEGVRIARSHGIKIDLYLLSPRYGLIREEEIVLPHLADMESLKKKELEALCEKLRIAEKFAGIMQQPYDIVILVLKREHLPLLGALKRGLSLSNAPSKVIVVSAPSLARLFGESIKFVGIRQIGKRAEAFVKLIDSLTTRTLKDYFEEVQ
ncbi:MAG: hypothetical protein H5T34_07230 [Candidatus Methanomethyliales bacterium]|nr:hypothetical protein [Candidatus Methanomethylicales archaeon]